jgi:FkbM family methyltransferase
MIRAAALAVLDALNLPLAPFGVQLVRARMAEATSSRRLRHLAKLGFRPGAAIDGGGFSGEWSREAARLFPGCRMVVVEPNPRMMAICRQNLRDLSPEPFFSEKALGPAPGSAMLNLWSGTSGAAASLLPHVSGEPSQSVKVEVTTLDLLTDAAGFTPDLIKLDLQGFEVPALRGGQRCLMAAEVVILEVGCLQAYVGRSSPREVIDIMYAAGFVLHDIMELGYRPYDGALLGADFVFLKSTSKLRAYPGYR